MPYVYHQKQIYNELDDEWFKAGISSTKYTGRKGILSGIMCLLC